MVSKPDPTFYLVDDSIPDTISSLKWSPNSNMLAASSWDGKVYLWDIKPNYYNTLSPQPMMNTDLVDPVLQISWYHDGSIIFAGCIDGSVKYWDLPQNKIVNLGQLQNAAAQVHWCETMNLLFILSWDKKITVVDCKQPNSVCTKTLNYKVRLVSRE
jgi:mRNA export factor